MNDWAVAGRIVLSNSSDARMRSHTKATAADSK